MFGAIPKMSKTILNFAILVLMEQCGAETLSQIYGKRGLSQKELEKPKLWPIYFSGEDFHGDSYYFKSGPYGSLFDGYWFSDLRHSLDGRSWEPRHWPNQINLRAGQSIDG